MEGILRSLEWCTVESLGEINSRPACKDPPFDRSAGLSSILVQKEWYRQAATPIQESFKKHGSAPGPPGPVGKRLADATGPCYRRLQRWSSAPRASRDQADSRRVEARDETSAQKGH